MFSKQLTGYLIWPSLTARGVSDILYATQETGTCLINFNRKFHWNTMKGSSEAGDEGGVCRQQAGTWRGGPGGRAVFCVPLSGGKHRRRHQLTTTAAFVYTSVTVVVEGASCTCYSTVMTSWPTCYHRKPLGVCAGGREGVMQEGRRHGVSSQGGPCREALPSNKVQAGVTARAACQPSGK